MRKLVMILVAILFLGLGAFGLILTPFLPLIYLDMDPPSWLSVPLAFGASLGCIAIGTMAGVMAWRKRNC